LQQFQLRDAATSMLPLPLPLPLLALSLQQLNASRTYQQLQVDAACAGGAELKLTVAGVSCTFHQLLLL